MEVTRMNPEAKAPWISALRSGDFKQGKSALRTKGDEYCCLGVLSQVAVLHGVITPPVLNNLGDYEYDENNIGLSAAVVRWAFGLDSPDYFNEDVELAVPIAGEGSDYPLISSFMGMNDSLEYSFAMIADVIEREL